MRSRIKDNINLKFKPKPIKRKTINERLIWDFYN